MLGNWNDFPSDWLGCGVYEHGPDCLCDVKITKPTPTVKDWVNDMWMGREICDIRGYGKPWTSSMLADYLSDLSQFHSALTLHGMGGRTGSGDADTNMLEDASFAGMTNVRTAVKEMLERMPKPSLVGALQILGITPEKFLLAVTQAKMDGAEDWDYQRMQQFENDVMERLKIATLTERYNLSENTYYRIKMYMRPIFSYHGISYVESASPERTAARHKAIQMIHDGHENSAIIEQIDSLYGIKYTTAAISKMRVRNLPQSI